MHDSVVFWPGVLCALAIVAQAAVFWAYWRAGKALGTPLDPKLTIPIRIFGQLTLIGTLVWVVWVVSVEFAAIPLWDLSWSHYVGFIWPLLFQVVAILVLFNRPRMLLTWCLGVQTGFWFGLWAGSILVGHYGLHKLPPIRSMGLTTLGVVLGPLAFLPLGWFWTRGLPNKRTIRAITVYSGIIATLWLAAYLATCLLQRDEHLHWGENIGCAGEGFLLPAGLPGVIIAYGLQFDSEYCNTCISIVALIGLYVLSLPLIIAHIGTSSPRLRVLLRRIGVIIVVTYCSLAFCAFVLIAMTRAMGRAWIR